MAQEALKVAIIGHGVVGQKRRSIIENDPRLKLVAVCDILFDDTHDNNGVLKFKDHHQLLTLPLDIVFVCTPNKYSPDICIDAMKAGLHVLCEKPPGRNLSDILRVREMEQKCPRLKIKFGFNHRYHQSINEAVRIIRTRELGPIISIKGEYGKSHLNTSQTTWRTDPDLAGGGILLDQGIHMVDLLRLFAGEFETIHSFVENKTWKYDVEDNAYALMKSKNGVVAFLHSSSTMWKHRFKMEINFEKGNILLDGILSGSKSYGDETIRVLYKEKQNQEVTLNFEKDESWKEEIADFIDAIINDREIINGSSFDALKAMELVFKIYNADTTWQSKTQELSHEYN